MYFKQFYLGCLAHASYLIASEGEAVVVDPQRDVDHYIAEAEREGAVIRYVVETHLHADFVSGHRELAGKTGAEIVFGARAEAEFPYRPVTEGDELVIGHVRLRALETPGHTPEGISWLVFDSEVSDLPQKVLTGDTLFIGDVGRPDLAGSRGYSSADMASMLYDSLHQKLLTLPDQVEVWPAHGAGSSCGRNISKETSSTIGQQRRMNWALQPMEREEFVRLMTSDLTPPPQYFAMDAALNRRGARPIGDLRALPLSPTEVSGLMKQGGEILDVRDALSFAGGHLPGATNIGLRGQFASWSGTLLSLSAPIVMVAASEAEAQEGVMRLGRVGLENVAGFLEGGIEGWTAAGLPLETISQISVHELHDRLASSGDLQIIDVRDPGEFEEGHIPTAASVPLGMLREKMVGLDHQKFSAVICGGGYRSSAAASLLSRDGFANLLDVVGGTSAWIGAGYEVER
jgi:hydroxyacylglutathione hydrolase